jgi:hypothetical protein
MLSPRHFLPLIVAGMLIPTISQASNDKSNTAVLTPDGPTGPSPVITFTESRLRGITAGQAPVDDLDLKKKLQTAMAKAMEPKSQCFTMRSYKFKRDDTAKDQLKPSGESTCEAASTFSLKDAVDSR